MEEEMLQILRDTDLKELAPVFEILAKRVLDWRNTNNGLVPIEIFPHCLGIGGKDFCLEVVILGRQNGRSGYWLKCRDDAGEQGWKGEYQICGTSYRTPETPDQALKRLSREIFGENRRLSLSFTQLKYLGLEIHSEPERGGVVAFTQMYVLRLNPEDRGHLSGTWELFDDYDFDNDRIVNHHRKTLEWVSNPFRFSFVRLG